MATTYREFLERKIAVAGMDGVECEAEEVSALLRPHQRDIVKWAVEGGRRAIFAQFGLGKTFMQCEISRILQKKAGGRTLTVCPLGVRQEFIRDGARLGVDFQFIRRPEEMDGGHVHFLTNYESVRDGRLSPELFNVVCLDEASVLRSYGSKTFQEFLPLFESVPYRFVATATPSPNRYKELIHYAGFLGIMDTGQSLTRFFQRDSTQANNLELNPHKEKEFWLWMHSWAIFLQRPSELGYSDEGYDLPELKVRYHIVESPPTQHEEKNGQLTIVHDSALDLRNAAREKRESIPARIAKVQEILRDDPESHYILWHDLESERRALEKAVPGVVSVYGSLDLETREQRIIDFSDGRIKYLATKPKISGSGCNFQRHCHKAVFMGIGYKFNDFIQSIHRIYRFLQTEVCEVHVICTEAERDVLDVLKKKWEEHKKLMETMSGIVTEHGLNKLSTAELKRSIGVERKVMKGELYEIAHNDCVDEARRKEGHSVDLIISSIPFSNHYEYTPSYNDFGHTDNNAHFWAQMDYLTPELLRILRPGRMACIHTKDRILFGNVTGAGAPTVSPFHAEAIFHYIRHGFDYMGLITVVTDVVRENNQTYRLGWTEQGRDGTKMGVGSPEYILLLRKPQTDRTRGYADVPVKKSKIEYSRARWQIDAHAFWRSGGDRLLSSEELSRYGADEMGVKFREFSRNSIYNYAEHVKTGEELAKKKQLPSSFMAIAPGVPESHQEYVWDDVTRMQTLNLDQAQRGKEAHICPLQLDIVERLITRYSNRGDLVYDPFGGIMTVPYCAVKMGRRGGGSELSGEYFRDGIHYLTLAESEALAPTLFEAEEIECLKRREAI